MTKDLPQEDHPDDDAGLYVISVAAELSGLHPQTLRQYDRLGLVSPDRTVDATVDIRSAILHLFAWCNV